MSNCAPSAVAQAGSWDTADDVTKRPKKKILASCAHGNSQVEFSESFPRRSGPSKPYAHLLCDCDCVIGDPGSLLSRS